MGDRGRRAREEVLGKGLAQGEIYEECVRLMRIPRVNSAWSASVDRNLHGSGLFRTIVAEGSDTKYTEGLLVALQAEAGAVSAPVILEFCARRRSRQAIPCA